MASLRIAQLRWATGHLVVAASLLLAAGCGEPVPPADLAPAADAGRLSIRREALPTATVGVPFHVVLRTADDTRGVTWAVDSGPLPPGLTLTSPDHQTAQLNGAPTTAGTFHFSVKVLETSTGLTALGAFVLRVDPSTITPLSIDLSVLPEGDEEKPYDAALTARGGSGEGYRWAVIAGALPSGMTLDGAGETAHLKGVAAPGTYRFTVEVSAPPAASAAKELTLVIRPAFKLVASVPAVAYTGRAFAAAFEAQGAVGKVSWVATGGLPPGLVGPLPVGGHLELWGTPSMAGSFSFTVAASDQAGRTSEVAISLRVVKSLEIVTTELPRAKSGVPYSVTLLAVGGSDTNYQWSSSGLPKGLTLTTAADGTGLVSGTPSSVASGAYVHMELTNDSGERASATYVLTIEKSPPLISTVSLPPATRGQAYLGTIEGTSVYPVAWLVTQGWAPPGIVLGASTEAQVSLSGTPAVCGTFDFTVQMSNPDGVVTARYSLTVSPTLPFEIEDRRLPAGSVGRRYSGTLWARNTPAAPVEWSIGEGSLPEGLVLSAASDTTGSLVGTPTVAGVYAFSVKATDANGEVALRRFTLRVAPALTWVALVHGDTFGGPLTVTIMDVTSRGPGASWDLYRTVGGGRSVNDISFSPDRSWVAFVDGDDSFQRSALYLADLRRPGSRAVLLNDRIDPGYSARVSWAPDGTKFVYAARTGPFQYQHIVVDVSGGTASSRALSTEPSGHEHFWSPDSTMVLFDSKDGSTLSVATVGGATRVFAMPAGARSWLADAWWSSDSSSVVVLGYGPGGGVALRVDVASPGAAPEALTPSLIFNPNLVVSSPDGSRLAFAITHADASDVYALDLRSRDLVLSRRANGAATPALEPTSWSPDSERVLLRGVTLERSGSSSWLSPDGSVYSMTWEELGTRAPLRLATAGLANGWAWRWTSDSRNVFYGGGGGALSVLSAVAPESPADLVSAKASSFAPLADSSRVVFLGSDPATPELMTLRLLDLGVPAASRAPVRLDSAAAPCEYFRLSPGFDAVFYFAPNHVRAFWMVDLSTPDAPGPPVQLLELKEGTFNYAVSDE